MSGTPADAPEATSTGAPTLRLVTALRSTAGPRHRSNQDSLGCSDEYVFVADGVGGHAGGDVASWTVAHRLMAAAAPSDTGRLSTDELRELVGLANAELGVRIARQPDLRGMATTFTGLFCAGDVMRVVHTGDSRAYLARAGEVRRVTRDDSPVQLMVDSGHLDEEEARRHPLRNVVLQCLTGAPSDAAAITITEVPTGPGDRWLVTSDGLTDVVDDATVARLLSDATDPDAAATALVAAARDAGAQDDVSVAVSDVVVGAPEGRAYRTEGAAADPSIGTVADLTR